jgi:hypothetical protein
MISGKWGGLTDGPPNSVACGLFLGPNLAALPSLWMTRRVIDRRSCGMAAGRQGPTDAPTVGRIAPCESKRGP